MLRPTNIHPESGYRFYDYTQLSDLARILALKDCGFSLDEVARIIQTHDASAITAMLRARALAQRALIATEEARLQRITARLDQLADAEGGGAPDVTLKRSEALRLLGVRRRVQGQREIGPFAVSVVERFESEGLWMMSPLIHLYFDDEVDEAAGEFDLFIGAAVSGAPTDEGAWAHIALPEGEELACVIYRGDYPRIGAAYAALCRWMESSGYQPTGPCREIYLRSPAHTHDPAEYVTEIQYPVTAAPAEPTGVKEIE